MIEGAGVYAGRVELFRRCDQVLLELAVGVGVGGEAEVPGGIDDFEGAEGHAAAQFFSGLVESEGLAEGREA